MEFLRAEGFGGNTLHRVGHGTGTGATKGPGLPKGKTTSSRKTW